jgi:hypothetical protein
MCSTAAVQVDATAMQRPQSKSAIRSPACGRPVPVFLLTRAREFRNRAEDRSASPLPGQRSRAETMRGPSASTSVLQLCCGKTRLKSMSAMHEPVHRVPRKLHRLVVEGTPPLASSWGRAIDCVGARARAALRIAEAVADPQLQRLDLHPNGTTRPPAMSVAMGLDDSLSQRLRARR